MQRTRDEVGRHECSLVREPLIAIVRPSKNLTTMSIDDPEVVDVIGIERDSDVVVLTICDHLDWYCADEHLLALHDKINRYLGFVENELLDAYPQGDCAKLGNLA